MQERKLDWCEKIPVGIMQLGTNLDIIWANEEAKRLLSLFQVLPSVGIPDELHSQLEMALNEGVIREGSVYALLVKSPGERYVRFLVQRWGSDVLILTLEDVTEFEWAKSEELTRRNASVKVEFEGGLIYVSERNLLPQYAGSYALNLYSGEKIEIAERDPHLIYQPQRLKPAQIAGS